jgi:hypothetical protein
MIKTVDFSVSGWSTELICRRSAAVYVFRDSPYEPLAGFWILTQEEAFNVWCISLLKVSSGASKGRCMGFLSKGETNHLLSSGLSVAWLHSLWQLSCWRIQYSPGPSCTLIKQWKSIKDSASSTASSPESQVKLAHNWPRVRKKVGWGPPKSLPKINSSTQQLGFPPDAN